MPDFKTDNWYVAVRRFGRDERDVREFVQPNCYAIQKLLPGLPAEGDAFILESWRYVAENIEYPSGFWVSPTSADVHEASFFGRRLGPVTIPGKIYHTFDFWQTPSETLAPDLMQGDCEDSTYCLVSLLLARIDRAWATLGKYGEMYHAWPIIKRDGKNYILESTLDSVPYETPWEKTEEDNLEYVPYLRFNKEYVEEVVPIEELDLTREHEGYKIKTIRESWRRR